MTQPTLTIGSATFHRGDYIMVGQRKVRITSLRGGYLTTRHYAEWLEPTNRRIEDWLLFPLSDLAYRVGRFFYFRGIKP